MTWKCERGEFCRELTIDPFTGEDLGPPAPRLLRIDDTCRCGSRLEGNQQITGECAACENAPLPWEG